MQKCGVNANGEVVMSRVEVQRLSRQELGKCLKRYNDWRRGRGAYKWSEAPEKNLPCPFSPATIGLIIDRAAKEVANG